MLQELLQLSAKPKLELHNIEQGWVTKISAVAASEDVCLLRHPLTNI